MIFQSLTGKQKYACLNFPSLFFSSFIDSFLHDTPTKRLIANKSRQKSPKESDRPSYRVPPLVPGTRQKNSVRLGPAPPIKRGEERRNNTAEQGTKENITPSLAPTTFSISFCCFVFCCCLGSRKSNRKDGVLPLPLRESLSC